MLSRRLASATVGASSSSTKALTSLLSELSLLQPQHQEQTRSFSSKKSSSQKSFRPRRKPSQSYRPFRPKKVTQKGPKSGWDVSKPVPTIDLDNIPISDATAEDELDAFGPIMSDAIRYARSGKSMDIEDQLRAMDYITAAPGSTEELVGERRAMAYDLWDHEDRAIFDQELSQFLEQTRIENMELDPVEPPKDIERPGEDGAVRIPETQLAHGDWGELLVRTDRVRKMWRGGRIESYRALVVAGNLRGCGGFGVGKAFEPQDAVELACRMARRNIFFVDRYRNRELTRDLVGRQNSCKMYLRTTDNGLRGNGLACEIMKLMGITNVVAKAHGNRNPYNVVRATYKALLTHESLDEIALKRGVRLINLQKARHLGV